MRNKKIITNIKKANIGLVTTSHKTEPRTGSLEFSRSQIIEKFTDQTLFFLFYIPTPSKFRWTFLDFLRKMYNLTQTVLLCCVGVTCLALQCRESHHWIPTSLWPRYRLKRSHKIWGSVGYFLVR